MGILFILTLFIFFIIVRLCKNSQYKHGAYYQVTENPYSCVKRNKGKYAEYLTYETLRHFENDGGKFLFNTIIPTNHNGTTEIDVILICSNGIFVFECKNYSGWIFGNELQRNWTQTLPQGRGRCHKEYFYNPIMQNAAHIKYLKNLLGKNIRVQSIIVFSDRCVLKDITIKSNDVNVVNHYNLANAITKICSQSQAAIYTEEEIKHIYNKLYPYTQLDYTAREKHIENSRKRA